MKRGLTALIMIAALLTGAYVVADQNVEKGLIQADYIVFENVDEIAEGSDLIVKAIVTGNSKNVVQEHDGFRYGHTITEVKVLSVLKGSFDEKQPLTVIEPTYTVDRGVAPGKIQMTYEEYTKLVPTSSYVLFLKWDDKIQGYWVRGLHQGKHNIDGKDNEELAAREHNKKLNLLNQAVISRYVK